MACTGFTVKAGEDAAGGAPSGMAGAVLLIAWVGGFVPGGHIMHGALLIVSIVAGRLEHQSAPDREEQAWTCIALA